MLYRFQLLDKLVLWMTAEYVHCIFMTGHLGSIIPTVLHRISISRQALPSHNRRDLCNFIYTLLSDGYINCTLPGFRQPRSGPRTGAESEYLIVLVSPL